MKTIAAVTMVFLPATFTSVSHNTMSELEYDDLPDLNYADIL